MPAASARAAALVALVATTGCGAGALRLAPLAPARCVVTGDPVAAPPPPARAESVPASPRPDAVWVDGTWTWSNARWVWRDGAWVAPAAGATWRRGALARGVDASLSWAPPAWVDAACAPVAAPAPLAPR